MDTSKIREVTLTRLQVLGLPGRVPLPLLESELRLRDAADVARRTNILHILYAVYLRGRDSAKFFYEVADQSGWTASFTEGERNLLRSGRLSDQDIIDLSWKKESCKALIWAGTMTNEDMLSDFSECDFSTYYHLLPPQKGMSAFLAEFRLRPLLTIAEHLDFYYCLHWFLGGKNRARASPTVPINLSVVMERRRALEWITHSEEWDVIALDT